MTPLESPIEWKFAAALRSCARRNHRFTYQNFVELPEGLTFGNVVDSYCEYSKVSFFGCAPQVTIGPHRVDFLFIVYAPPSYEFLVVECDGHDFHERTKDQAQRDRKRDRWLTSLGIHSMRFTGSEIARDAEACVLEVHEFLARKFRSAHEELLGRTIEDPEMIERGVAT